MLMNNRSQYNTVGGQTMLCAGAPSTPKLPMWVQANYLNFSVSGYSSIASVPRGYPMAIAYVPSQRAGGIISKERTNFGITGTMTGYLGYVRTASASFSIDGLADGQLTAGGVAAGTIGLSGAATGLLDLLGTATGTIGVNGSVDINADGFASASGTITLDGSAAPIGVGIIVANSAEVSEFSPANLAAAVWGATSSSYNSTGTMGEKLNDAGSASNPWTEVIESGLSAAEVMRLILAFAANNAEGLEGANPVFKSRDGSKARITATYAAGTRTVTGIDPT